MCWEAHGILARSIVVARSKHMSDEFIYGDVMLIPARGNDGRLTHILKSFLFFHGIARSLFYLSSRSGFGLIVIVILDSYLHNSSM